MLQSLSNRPFPLRAFIHHAFPILPVQHPSYLPIALRGWWSYPYWGVSQFRLGHASVPFMLSHINPLVSMRSRIAVTTEKLVETRCGSPIPSAWDDATPSVWGFMRHIILCLIWFYFIYIWSKLKPKVLWFKGQWDGLTYHFLLIPTLPVDVEQGTFQVPPRNNANNLM